MSDRREEDLIHMSLEELAHRLGGEVSGSQVLCPGPGHSPEDRSLCVKVNRDHTWAAYSHAGDNIFACKDHVREKVGLPAWNGKGNGSSHARTIAETYDYTDESGTLLFQVIRYEPKGFNQRRPNGNAGWSWKLGSVPRKLYRLPELIEAVANDHPVFICEGEKAVNALVKIGIPATCSPHGAGKWRDTYSPYLKDAKVIILPDDDEPGRHHAEQVATSLRGVAASVKVLALPGLPEGGDVYDWLSTGGGTAEKLWALVEALKANGSDPGQPPSGLIIVRASDVTPVAVDWIWDGRIARGKITIIAGLPDVGKSQIGAYIAARITKGEHWPNGARAAQGDVVILASEDGIKDTWVPRLMAAGADLAHVHFIKMVIDKHGKRRSFNLQEDLEVLGEKLNALQRPQLLIIDPITSYLGKVDAHRTPDVRAVMDPISDFAERCGIGVFAVTHPPKSQVTAMNAFTGSMAFVAGARIAFIVVPEPETERRLMLAVKNNIGPKAQGRGYTIEGKTVAPGIIAPRIIWDDAPVDMTADQALVAINRHNKDGGSLTEAKDFLRELLAKGPIPAADGEEACEANGISERTQKRARKKLGIKASKTGFDGGWIWSMGAAT